MCELKEISAYAIQAMKNAGADKCQCEITCNLRNESNSLGQNIYLLREYKSYEVSMVAVVDGAYARYVTSSLEKSAIDRAAHIVTELAGLADESEDSILKPGSSSQNDQKHINIVPVELYKRFEELIGHIAKYNPDICTDACAYYDQDYKFYENTDGVTEERSTECCGLGIEFVARKDRQSSSKYFAGVPQIKYLNKPFVELGNIADELKKAEIGLNTERIPGGPFSGTILLAPGLVSGYVFPAINLMAEQCKRGIKKKYSKGLSAFIAFSDEAYTENSSDQVSPTTAMRIYLHDGDYVDEAWRYEGAEKVAYEEKYAELQKSHKYCIYGVGKGNVSYENLLHGIKKGIVLGYISGSEPDCNGDFSGVAKNSFYIENGEIKYAVKEVMVRGNLLEMMQNVECISQERKIENGCLLMPWMAIGNMRIN